MPLHMTANIIHTLPPRPPVPAGYGCGIVNQEFWVSTPPLANRPSTIPASQDSNSPDKGTDIPVHPHIWNYLRSINHDAGYKFVRSIGYMYINKSYDQSVPNPDPPPVAVSILTGGSFFIFDREENDALRVVSHNYLDQSGLDPALVNWERTPELVAKACCVAQDGKITNPGSAIDAYWLRISKTELWIKKNRCEILPVGITYKFKGMNVYNGNDEPLMTVDRGGNRTFYNGWKIETFGPVPPAWWI